MSQSETGLPVAEVATRVRERFAGAIGDGPGPKDDVCLWVTGDRIHDVVSFLKQEHDFDVLMDETCVDHPERTPRFEVIYNLYSMGSGRRIFLKVGTDDSEPGVPTVADLYGCADWMEREVFDMFGVKFAGHPNLTRILLYEGFVGHALRKDYPYKKRQPLIGPADGPDYEARNE
jgi:NADH-quinone oxidoreductase subunit C